MLAVLAAAYCFFDKAVLSFTRSSLFFLYLDLRSSCWSEEALWFSSCLLIWLTVFWLCPLALIRFLICNAIPFPYSLFTFNQEGRDDGSVSSAVEVEYDGCKKDIGEMQEIVIEMQGINFSSINFVCRNFNYYLVLGI